MKARMHRGTQAPRLADARGFTLIELLLVLIILGVLAAVVVPRFAGRSEDAKIGAAKTQIALFKTQLGMIELDTGRFPSSEEGLNALIHQPNTITNWKGPYAESREIPKDPWGQDYQYKYPGDQNPNGYDLWSLGPDGQGNHGIDNWSPQK